MAEGISEDALRDQTLHAAKHELQAERHLIDPKYHAKKQQQRAEPTDNGVCDEHSKLGLRQGSPDLHPIKRFASSSIAVLLQDIRGNGHEFGIR